MRPPIKQLRVMLPWPRFATRLIQSTTFGLFGGVQLWYAVRLGSPREDLR